MFDIIHWYTRHESFIWEIWHSYVWHDSFYFTDTTFTAYGDSSVAHTTHGPSNWHVWHNSWICVTRTTHKNMTHLQHMEHSLPHKPQMSPIIHGSFADNDLEEKSDTHHLLPPPHIPSAATATGKAKHCNTLQHTATHCNTLQHTATHCHTLSSAAAARTSRQSHTLRQTVTQCKTLQHIATHCNTLQHTLRCNNCTYQASQPQ